MAQVVRGAAVVAGIAGAGLVAAKRVAGLARGKLSGAGPEDDRPRWHAVTVYRNQDEVAPGGQLPAPLAELGNAVDVRLKEAPGGKGTEIHVRPLGEDGRGGEIRSALRRAKRLLETGEILEPDSPGSAKPTPLNAPLRAATAHGMDGGRL
jgi:hypothetical protein